MSALERLRQALASFDEEALAALASRGLLARARKDLAKATGQPLPDSEGEDGGRLRLVVSGQTVSLAVPPADSVCTCPSPTLCRHVLAALLFVRGEDARPRAGNALEELLAIGDETLIAYAGKPLLRRAARAVARGLEAEVTDQGPGGALVVALPALGATCRFFPGAGLAGMHCSCRAAGACEHRLLALLAAQARHGTRVVALEEEWLEASAGAPRTRDEVREAVTRVLCEAVATGLSRLSRATETRLRTLAMSAHGVDLPRLTRELDGLASQAGALLARQVQAGTSGFLLAAARAQALVEALRRPDATLVGEHRSAYAPVGELVLHGLGARTFRTPSGFVGLRLVFWDETAGRFAAWTDARPEGTPGFDPVDRFAAPGPWTGCPSPDAACRSRFRLAGAQRNARGRLSGREASRYTPLGPSDPLSLPPLVADFGTLVDRAHALFGRGLTGRRELEDLVLLRTAAWGPPAFDPVRQELVREVRDGHGRRLRVVVPHLPESPGAVDVVETAEAASLTGLLAQLRLWRGRLVAQPIALYEGPAIRCPTLEKPAKRTKRPASSESARGDGEDAPAEPEAPPTGTAVGRAVAGVAGALDWLAEAGLAAGRASPLAEAAAEAERLGLGTLARAARRVSEALEAARDGGEAGRAGAALELLRAVYVGRLHADAETVRVACAGLS